MRGEKIIFIEKEPYWLSLPSGEREDPNSDWNRLVYATGGDDSIMHWSGMGSWVLDRTSNPWLAAYRGYNSEHYWKENRSDYRFKDIGFRPILTPLSPDSWSIEEPAFLDIPDGSIIRTGALYMGDNPVRIPANPSDDGDMISYDEDDGLTIGDAEGLDDSYIISWIVVGNKLIADRNLIRNISLEDLRTVGIV